MSTQHNFKVKLILSLTVIMFVICFLGGNVWVQGKDYHTLRSSQVDMVVAAAKLYGYRKSPSASGSTARMFWEYLQRRR